MDNILLPIERRKKEIKIGKPLLEYFTIDLVVAFAIVGLILTLSIMFAFPYSSDFSNRDYYGIAEVEGYSMYPYMHQGEYVLYMTNQHPNFDIKVGDIIVYYNEDAGVYVAHRVVDIYTSDGVEYLVVKGDNNNYYDEPITVDDVDAKVIHVIPNYFEKWCYEVWLNLFNWW